MLIIILAVFSCSFTNPFVPMELNGVETNQSFNRATFDTTKFYKFRNVKSGLYLTVIDTSNGSALILKTETSTNYQLWTFFEYQGTYVIVNKGSGKVIEVDQANKIINGATIYQWLYRAAYPDQFWYPEIDQNNAIKLTSLGSGFCLTPVGDGDGSALIQTNYTGVSQMWIVTESP